MILQLLDVCVSGSTAALIGRDLDGVGQIVYVSDIHHELVLSFEGEEVPLVLLSALTGFISPDLLLHHRQEVAHTFHGHIQKRFLVLILSSWDALTKAAEYLCKRLPSCHQYDVFASPEESFLMQYNLGCFDWVDTSTLKKHTCDSTSSWTVMEFTQTELNQATTFYQSETKVWTDQALMLEYVMEKDPDFVVYEKNRGWTLAVRPSCF